MPPGEEHPRRREEGDEVEEVLGDVERPRHREPGHLPARDVEGDEEREHPEEGARDHRERPAHPLHCTGGAFPGRRRARRAGRPYSSRGRIFPMNSGLASSSASQ